jgi:hypothetical protein
MIKLIYSASSICFQQMILQGHWNCVRTFQLENAVISVCFVRSITLTYLFEKFWNVLFSLYEPFSFCTCSILFCHITICSRYSNAGEFRSVVKTWKQPTVVVVLFLRLECFQKSNSLPSQSIQKKLINY